MSIARFSVHKPVTIFMCAMGIILLGVISWSRLSQELFPPITYPQITIVTNYENAAPEEIEALITRVIEESVSAASGIRKVSSTSREGTSLVFCEFDWNMNMDFAALNVREKIDLIKEKLPRDAEDPIVMKYNPFDTPIMILSVSGDDRLLSPYELRETARRVIKDEIEKVDGVAQVMLTGGREREILVELSQPKLRAFQVSILDIVELLKQANLNYPAGTIETSFYEYLVRTMGEFRTVAEMFDVPLLIEEKEENAPQQNERTEEEKERRKRVIYLRELGTVKDTLKEQTSISRYNRTDNITLSVQRQADANTLAVNKEIIEKLKILRDTLPPAIKIKLVYDESVFIKQSIAQLRDNALQGGVLAFFILLLFLRNFRSAFVVTAGIPIAILFTLILMYFNKLSLNMMSLGGLALGVGMLVDNGIVVIENIYRHRQSADDPKAAAVTATDEVFSSIIGSTLTTVAVFLPLIFVVGIAGQLFKQLALTITFSLVASIVTSLALVPMLMSLGKIKKSKKPVVDEQEQLKASLRKKRGLPDAAVYWGAVIVIGGAVVLAVVSFQVLMHLDQEFLPKLDQRQFQLKVNLPAGTNLRATDAVIKRIEDTIAEFEAVKDITVNIGSNKDDTLAGSVEVLGSNQANIIVNLYPLPGLNFLKFWQPDTDRNPAHKISTADLVQQLKDRLLTIDLQNADIEYILQESVFKSVFAGSAPVVVILRGYDMDTIMIPATKEMERRLADVAGVYGVKNSLSPPSPEVKVAVRKDRASLYQLTVNQIAAVAQAAVKGYVATKFKEEGREYDIRVRLREEDRNDFNRIGKLFIFSPIGISVFLDQVATLTRGLGPTEIKRERKQRVVFITANIYDRALNEVVADVKSIVDDIRLQLPQNYTIELGGENEEMQKSFTSLRFALILALVLVYMIMASEFESLLQPFIIMFTVPLSLIGVSWALFFSHTALSTVVALGGIMLGGIVVNNGILLIDFINLARRHGASIIDAAIQASKVRMRPIIMTSATTIVGLLPLALALGEGAELRAPMARTVMGGLASATLLTLFVVPAAYILLETVKERIAQTFRPLTPDELASLVKPKGTTFEELDISLTKPAPVPVASEIVSAEDDEAVADGPVPAADEIPSDTDTGKFLNSRQQSVLEYLRVHNAITRLEYVVQYKVPLPIADRELQELVDRSLLEFSGDGPQKQYFLRRDQDVS